MAGAFHFVAMAILALATAATLSRSFGRPTWKRLGAAALVGVAGLFGGALFLHACDAGAPLTSWALGTGCAILAVLFVREPRARAVLAIGALLVMLGLGAHYTALVHGDAWIGNPASMNLAAPARAEWHTWATLLWAR